MESTCVNIISIFKRHTLFSSEWIDKEGNVITQDISSQWITGRNDQVDQWENKFHDLLTLTAGGGVLWNANDNFSICNPIDYREHFEFWPTFVPQTFISVLK